jgi:hypothetical protein
MTWDGIDEGSAVCQAGFRLGIEVDTGIFSRLIQGKNAGRTPRLTENRAGTR